MRKHFMCTHTFSSEKAWEKSSDPDTVLTDRQFFDKLTGQRARVLQHWRGSDDFFFCHWFAESEEAILKALDQTGSNDRIVTAAYETPRFVSKNALTGKPVINPFSN